MSVQESTGWTSAQGWAWCSIVEQEGNRSIGGAQRAIEVLEKSQRPISNLK
jgi:hypothetical protein